MKSCSWPSRVNNEDMDTDFTDRFENNPDVCGGQTVIKGTRVLLRTILADLAHRASLKQILADYPSLREEDVWAVIAFAARSAEEDMPLAGMPGAHAS